MAKDRVYIEKEECVGCGTCRAVCPCDAIEVADGRFWVVAELCSDCGICVPRCQVCAIKVKKEVLRREK